MVKRSSSPKNALITGANSGIGKQIALLLAARGFNIAIHYLAKQETNFKPLHVLPGVKAAQELWSEIEKTGAKAVLIESDLMKEGSAQSILNDAINKLGSIDILINNAAHCEGEDTFLEMDYPKLIRSSMVNDVSATMLISEFARRHKAAGKAFGRIINVSTDSAQKFSGQVSYGASKAYMEAITRSAAIELGPFGITVNCIAPGPVQTGWMTEELVQSVSKEIPMRRVGLPADIAETVLFLTSEKAGWITGQVIKVSGGNAL